MRTTLRRQELARLERFTEEPNHFGAYRIALGFPNSYEIGMSNLGFQWVYRLFNRIPDLVCERFFSGEGEPAVTFESGTPLSDFGLLAWSLSWEMDVVNIVRTLSAAGIPLRREARDERHPLLLVGGDIARMNPAVLSPFVDVFALGDGERLVPAIADLAKRGLDRATFLDEIARLAGFFVPGVQGTRAEATESARVVIQQPMTRKDIRPDFEVPHTTILTPRTELAVSPVTVRGGAALPFPPWQRSHSGTRLGAIGRARSHAVATIARAKRGARRRARSGERARSKGLP
jgi:radical SAM superfamily enzyme YgiQ (UPF0313 family)